MCLLIVFKIMFLPKGHTEIVRILVNKCNLEEVDDYRISPLFVAAQYGQRGCLEILVNAGKYDLLLMVAVHLFSSLLKDLMLHVLLASSLGSN